VVREGDVGEAVTGLDHRRYQSGTVADGHQPPKFPQVGGRIDSPTQTTGVMSSSWRRSSRISRRILTMIAGLLSVDTPRVRGK
jgi:hypothetical protein